MENKYKILALFGKSGAGKDTIQKWLTTNYNMNGIISCTTRPPRDYERDGIHYHFLSNEEFAQKNEAWDNEEDDAKQAILKAWIDDFTDKNRYSFVMVYPSSMTLERVIDGKDGLPTTIFTIDHTTEKEGILYNVLANHPEKKGFPGDGCSPIERDKTMQYKFILN